MAALRRTSVAASLVLALAAAGCGGGSGSSGSSTTGGGAKSASDPGHALFVSVGCSSCHTLKAAAAHGQVGPDLDTLAPTEAQVAKQVTDGGGGMPAFKDQLSSKQIQQVASYVAKASGG
ncbi:MAG: sulfide dehydrogenase [Conexibacter sp.]|nr:sulfide dehydrogenase [Conexibacter sp.]